MAKGCGSFTPGKMRHRVQIQRSLRIADGQGGGEDIWETIATVWALVTPANGHERYQAMRLETPVTHKVKMRWRADVGTKNRLLFEGRVLNIVEALNENEDKAFLLIKAIEIVEQ